jgi:hypothetical protein
LQLGFAAQMSIAFLRHNLLVLFRGGNRQALRQ